MSSPNVGVGAEDFLARYAPNLSRKERGSLTEMVRAAVREYMSENRLLQPPPPRLLAHMMQQRRRPDSSARSAAADDDRQTGRPRPATARGWKSGVDDEDLCLVGSATGIQTDSPRYAQVSPKFAPERKHFPATLMGFADCPEATEQWDKIHATLEDDAAKDKENGERDVSVAKTDGAQPAAPVQEPARAQAPKTATRPASAANWLTWRGATPFCASDRELRAFRHRQNPRKPMPEELPHVSLYRRPRTARGRLVDEGNAGSSADKGILSWMEGANEHDKQVAYNLMKAIGSSGGVGGTGFEGLLGVKGTASAAFDRGNGGPTRDLTLPPPEERHTFGKRTRPPTPQRLFRPNGPAGTTPKALFAGVEENYASVRSRVHPARDYVHPGSGFTNACPPYRSNFVVHPDWVSEQTNPAPPPIRRTNKI